MTTIHTFHKAGTWLLVLLLIVSACIPAHGQITKKSLDKMYKNKCGTEFQQALNQQHEKTIAAFFSVQNDTLDNISKLFYAVLPEQYDTNICFFLQPFFPLIYVGEKKLSLSESTFVVAQNQALKPISYNSELLDAVLEFFGSDPTETSVVMQYLKYGQQLKKRKIKAAKKIMADFDNKTAFIGQYLRLPATWGKLDRNLIPCTISYIRFNETMTEAEVKYDLVSEGGTAIFRLSNGSWEKAGTLLEWIH